MAASSSSPYSGGHCKYDVFLSFRGEDTRKNFVCHLYKALEQKAIHTFIDSEELEKGNKISELLNAVDESRISVVVLSQNYATSTWCLKELVKIMECEDKKQQIVVPIFYEVDPSDIRKLKKMFGEAFAKHEQNPNLDKEVLETWKTALKGITDLSGWDSRQYKDDIELIEKIVGDILEKWIHIPRPSSLADNLVGMDHHIKEVSLRLCRGKNDVGVVGIWGMGGIGKTTIARAVYDKIAHQFEHKGFFYNVKERFRKKDEAQMRGELLSMILKGNEQSVDIFNQGSNAILERLGKKKVLVVLDDVETFSQIEALLGDFYSFGVGSRILVTTRDKESVLAGVYETYEPRCLDDNESRELFLKHAFRKNQLSQECSDLLERAIEYARGLPLALKVLGASLCDKNIHQWKQRLEKINEIPQRKILDVLRTSLEGLDHQEKAIFLDIACLFRGLRKKFVAELLESLGFCALDGLSVLEDRALITERFWRLDMHDLLQEMGRGIVRLESPLDPGKRSRLWSCDDVNRVLTQNTATDAVECLKLDLSNSQVDLCIHTGAFIRMTKLRLLMIYYSFFSASNHLDYFDVDDDDDDCDCDCDGSDDFYEYDYGDCDCDGDGEYYFQFFRSYERLCPIGGKQLWMGDLECLSQELRFLVWHGCPLKSLPSTFNPTNLVQLDMRVSHIQQLWEGIKSGCSNLETFPEILEVLTKLKWLYLDGTAIKELSSSINNLTGLRVLNLKNCTKLKTLPTSIHMRSLQTLFLNGCSNLGKFPEFSGMEELSELLLDETAIKGLPSSINLLPWIRKLSMRNCKSLVFLPDSICNLAYLTHLDLQGCTKLKTLPTSIHMRSLQTLFLNGCSNLGKFPEISGSMNKLSEFLLDETAIKGLPSSINLLPGIRKLSMRNCKSLVFLPDSICNLAYLTHLDLQGCTELKTLPTSIHMRSLQTLFLNGCSNLGKFPEISGSMNKLSEFLLDETAIKGLPSSINLLPGIRKLSMRNCKSLVFLLDSICNLAYLTHLDLQGCTELKTLPTSIHMRSLQTLFLNGCSNLGKFPEISGSMNKLSEFLLDETAIKGLPSSIKLLPGIKKLSMRNCKSLESLPDSICNWALTRLDLTGCTELKTLPTSIDMSCLLTLKLDGCSSLDKFPEMSGIMNEQPKLPLDETAIKGLPSSIKEHCSYSALRHLGLSDCNLLELSDGISHLSSLRTLKMCRTNLESLPVTMNRLCCLTHLELEACKRLKSIPELSSSINYIDAHECTALETVSKPKPLHRGNNFFTFSNCLQLVQTNLFRDIVEKYADFQDNYRQPLQLKMCLPGSEVPDWFTHRSRGFSVSVPLPANWLDCSFLGFAICAVLKYQDVHHYTSPLSATCLCTFKGRSDECSFSFDLLDSVFRIDRILQSDHIFQGYVSWSDCHLIPEGKRVNETYTEATFQIVVESEFTTEQHRITSSGVRFVYGPSSCGQLWDWISFYNTCEMRNEETQGGNH
ncbi:disease resistance protein RPV1-like [Rosa rugosa]|uniref:disease resistance protein RPV1-like n=1 Tax=Rosa rugosa TaxID=74645 RepID=UPI002B406EC6|nr:disease resistance protein RPV1-like [Rosa rugosa]